jgi:hypothetical protein
MLESKKLIAWFAQNANYRHPKLFPLPQVPLSDAPVHKKLACMRVHLFALLKDRLCGAPCFFHIFFQGFSVNTKTLATDWTAHLAFGCEPACSLA